MPTAAIEVVRLTCRERAKIVLEDVSLAVQPGRFLAVLGRSGSGKSALMRVLAGFARPGSGSVSAAGVIVDALPVHRRGFGVVQQQDALFAGRTLEENVALPLRLRRVRRGVRKRLVEAALELVQLQGSAGKRAKDASPGEIALALLARAAVFGPKVLLLDDPSGSRDEADRGAMLLAVQRVHAMLGCATVMTTRDGREAMALADEVAVLERGRVVQIAPPEELQDRPLSAEVARMAGETNLLPGIVEEAEDEIVGIRLACGPLAFGRAQLPMAVGDACMLGIGPARIAVAPVRATDMGERALDAVVVDTVLMGDLFRLRLLLGSGAELIVTRPLGAGLRGLAPGRGVAIAWQPYHAAAFPDKRG